MKTKEAKISKTRSREVKPAPAPQVKNPLTVQEFLNQNPTLWAAAWAFMWRGFAIVMFLYVSFAVFIAFLTTLFSNLIELLK